MAARSAGLKPSSFQFSSLWSSSSVSPALRPPGRLAAIQKAHWLAKDVARYTIALVRRSTKPGPISAALNGMKFLSAAGRRARARRNGLGCLDRLSRLARNSFCAGLASLIGVAIGTSINAVDEFPVAFHEIQFGELELGLPMQIVKDQVPRLAREVADAEEDQLEGVFPGIGVAIAGHDFAGSARDAQLLLQFACQGLFGALARLHLAAGELPFQGMRLERCALSHQDFALALENRRHHLKHVNIAVYRIPSCSSGGGGAHLPCTYMYARICTWLYRSRNFARTFSPSQKRR